MIERFGDPERGGFFSTSADHEELIARRKDIGDHPIPSGNCAAALGLLRLAALTGERALRAAGRGRLAPLRRPRRPPPRRLRPPAAGARLPPRADPGGGAGRRRLAELAAAVAARSARMWCSRAGRRARSRRCWRADHRRRPARRLCLRELRLPGAGHRPAELRVFCNRPPTPICKDAPRARLLFTFPAGRRAKWIVFALWFLAIFIAAGPANLPGKFEDAESNEATSYLPGDAESTKALNATEELQNGEIAPAVIVFRRDSGLTAGRLQTSKKTSAR